MPAFYPPTKTPRQSVRTGQICSSHEIELCFLLPALAGVVGRFAPQGFLPLPCGAFSFLENLAGWHSRPGVT
jgi:hypothetical protein